MAKLLLAIVSALLFLNPIGSVEAAIKAMKGLSEEDKENILGRNAMRLFMLNYGE